MNTQDQAIALVLQERVAQDAVWRNGNSVENQYRFAAPHILLLEEQVTKLRARWYGARDESTLQDRLVKVAAIALRALQEIETRDEAALTSLPTPTT